MPSTIITHEDLQEFREQLLGEIEDLLTKHMGERPKQWLRSQEVMERFEISSGTLQNLRGKGILAHSRLGTIIYYDAEHIHKILNKNKTQNPH